MNTIYILKYIIYKYIYIHTQKRMNRKSTTKTHTHILRKDKMKMEVKEQIIRTKRKIQKIIRDDKFYVNLDL